MGGEEQVGRPGVRRTGPAIALLRASHPEPTAMVTALTVALAISTGRSGAGVVAVGAAVLAGQLSVGWHNDWLDAPRDAAAGRADKPVAAGVISRRTVAWCALAALTATVPLSFASGWRAAPGPPDGRVPGLDLQRAAEGDRLVLRALRRGVSRCWSPSSPWAARRPRGRRGGRWPPRPCSAAARTWSTWCLTWPTTWPRASGASPTGSAGRAAWPPPWSCCWPPR